MLDLDAYFRRIEHAGPVTPSPETLAALHLAHATHIPFENLDILLGRPIRLDLQSLQAKLVTARRGGYCFEQNLLCSAVLEELGFQVTRLAARVRQGTTRVLPRTHMLFVVDLAGARWIADVGFGLSGLVMPIPLTSGVEVRQFAWTYRLVETRDRWRLQWLEAGAFVDLYEFTLEPQELADYEMASYYTSTHPHSRFVQTLTAQRITPDARYRLRNRELTTDRGTSATTRIMADDDELLHVLAETFGLNFPRGTRFRYGGD